MASSPQRTVAPRPAPPKRRRKLYENRIRWVSVLFVGPSFLASVLLIHDTGWTNESKVSLIILLLLLALIMEAVLHDQVIRPLQTFANVVSSLREEDYSFRARGAAENDALGELALEINALAQTLAERKTEAIEATELLKRVVEEIDVPLFTFDPNGRLRLVNTAGAALLHSANGELLGRTAAEIGLTPYLQPQTAAAEPNPLSPNARWLVKKTSFREKGVPHTLFVLADVSHALREEERNAWRRLIRVLGHELNNSLTPIKSIAGTLRQRVHYTELPDHERVDFDKGLGIIESRAASLNRFLQGYRSLAQMPKPALRSVSLTPLIERIAALELRIPVTVERGPETQANIDPDQFEQMLI
ncbi:MAG TPA: ATP-binding protein, partial [Terriglobales bacterium]